MLIPSDAVDVSQSQGIPLGGIGTGYSMFGRYGFVRQNFDSTPDLHQDIYPYHDSRAWDYSGCRVEPPTLAFVIRQQGRTKLLQEQSVDWLAGCRPVKKVNSFAKLPKGLFQFEDPDLGMDVSMQAFSPMIPHDLDESSIPVQVFDVELKNTSAMLQEGALDLVYRHSFDYDQDAVWVNTAHGEFAFACVEGTRAERGCGRKFVLKPGEFVTMRFIVAWYYPYFKTPSPCARKIYRRYYTRRFNSAMDVLRYAEKRSQEWLKKIERWHDGICVPAPLSRMWFSSLSSVITSTLLSDDPYFFEIETPHFWINTMDVSVYSSWCYLINWPELERMDMNQYLSSIPMSGENEGFVWHSLWHDASHYVEEPTFLTRLFRDYLWFNDREWLEAAEPIAKLAAGAARREGRFGRLLDSRYGNQSYDLWKMPGISSYVNIAWIYALYALEKISVTLKKTCTLEGEDIQQYRIAASAEFDRLLWNERTGCWNCFYRTPGAVNLNTEDSVFSDQLFGKWVLSIVPESQIVLPLDRVRQTLRTIYEHNCVADPQTGFRGWVNGMLPGRRADLSETHSKTCWLGAQLNLASLLGEMGEEEASLDVFCSVEKSLHNNHLAVGEWNQSIDGALNVLPLAEEPGKDTPRFPSYPRYKSCWEYLVRILGVTMDETYLYLSPFRTIDYVLKNIIVGGVTFSIQVSRWWDHVTVNGQSVNGPIRLQRGNEQTVDIVCSCQIDERTRDAKISDKS